MRISNRLKGVMRSSVGAALFLVLFSGTGGKEKDPGTEKLFEAIVKGDVDAVKELLEENHSLADKDDAAGVPPLLEAIMRGEAAIVKALLETDPETDYGFNGDNALSLAVWNQDKALVKVLLEHGTKKNNYVVFIRPSLMKACHADNLDIIKLIFKHWKKPPKGAYGNVEVLKAAALGRGTTVLKYLVDKKKADVSDKNMFNQTVLHLVAQEGKHESAKFLVKKSVSTFERDNMGKSALDYAEDNKDKKMEDILWSQTTKKKKELMKEIKSRAVLTFLVSVDNEGGAIANVFGSGDTGTDIDAVISSVAGVKVGHETPDFGEEAKWLIREKKGKLKACFSGVGKGKKKKGKAAGKWMNLALRAGSDGSLSDFYLSASSDKGEDFEKCVRKVVEKIKFPTPPVTGSMVIMTMEFK